MSYERDPHTPQDIPGSDVPGKDGPDKNSGKTPMNAEEQGQIQVNASKNSLQKVERFDIFLIGVGGQGIGLLSETLLRAADAVKAQRKVACRRKKGERRQAKEQ